jgi:hypothetical protein
MAKVWLFGELFGKKIAPLGNRRIPRKVAIPDG